MSYAKQNEILNKEYINLMSNYTNYYVNYKLNNDDNSYLRLEKNLQKNKKKMYDLQQTIDENEDLLLKKIYVTEEILKKEQIKNKKLTLQETRLDSLDKASYQLLEDKINMYLSKKKDISNYILGSICLMYYIIYK